MNAEGLKLDKLTIFGSFIELKSESFQHNQLRDQNLVDKILNSRISKFAHSVKIRLR